MMAQRRAVLLVLLLGTCGLLCTRVQCARPTPTKASLPWFTNPATQQPIFKFPSFPPFGQPTKPIFPSFPPFSQPTKPNFPSFPQPTKPIFPSFPPFTQPAKPIFPAFPPFSQPNPNFPSIPPMTQPTFPTFPSIPPMTQSTFPTFLTFPSIPPMTQPTFPTFPPFPQPNKPNFPSFPPLTQPTTPLFPSFPPFPQPNKPNFPAFPPVSFPPPLLLPPFGLPSGPGFPTGIQFTFANFSQDFFPEAGVKVTWESTVTVEMSLKLLGEAILKPVSLLFSQFMGGPTDWSWSNNLAESNVGATCMTPGPDGFPAKGVVLVKTPVDAVHTVVTWFTLLFNGWTVENPFTASMDTTPGTFGAFSTNNTLPDVKAFCAHPSWLNAIANKQGLQLA